MTAASCEDFDPCWGHDDGVAPADPPAKTAGTPSDPGDLGQRVAFRRGELGMTRDELARRSGLSPGYLVYLEENPAEVTTGTLLRLAAALESTVPYLLGEGTSLAPGRAGPAAHPVFEVIPRHKCDQLLASGGVGRVVMVDERGPVAVPVNFALLDGDIVFRTAAATTAAGPTDSWLASKSIESTTPCAKGGACSSPVELGGSSTPTSWPGRAPSMSSPGRAASATSTSGSRRPRSLVGASVPRPETMNGDGRSPTIRSEIQPDSRTSREQATERFAADRFARISSITRPRRSLAPLARKCDLGSPSDAADERGTMAYGLASVRLPGEMRDRPQSWRHLGGNTRLGPLRGATGCSPRSETGSI